MSLSDKFSRVEAARKQVVGDFMKRQNVVACGIGLKVVNGETVDEPCLAVSVTRKKPLADLPEGHAIPAAVGDVPTDVIETGEIVAHGLDRRLAIRPVRPGMSIGHRDGTAGTAGCVVRRGDQLFMLSANHVMALLGQAAPGDPILQPGPADGGTAANIFAELAAFVPLTFLDDQTPPPDPPDEPQGCAAILYNLVRAFRQPQTASPVPLLPSVDNYVDAAVAVPVPGVRLNPSIVDIGGPPVGIVRPALGMKVVKSGRTTGLTHGRVIQMDVTVDVRFGDRRARFVNQIMTTSISQPGDSGSLVLDYERRALGLLFSGSETVSLCTPIGPVLKALNVDLVFEDTGID
ncbi:MAG: hypothetical protein Kow00124_03630 [Anaerolineae bacterium]